MALTKETVQFIWACVAISIAIFEYFTFPQVWVPSKWASESPGEVRFWAQAAVTVANLCIMSIIGVIWFAVIIMSLGGNVPGKDQAKPADKKQ